ncbi:energy transducer TonB [Winogradskyella tangerina]|uniref:energy transducer TonB n=1 Tax=Winogradskyella tangerina TaxID=2023240 RepID=UPI000DBEA4D4|nr:energy transducer TonB [Winogradskyella tangerina]
MKSYFSLSIPEPCHEDWSKMTPNDRGRYCQSCSKTVIDFTTMNIEEIQDYIHNHRDQRICGHIKQSQLDTLNLRIPKRIFDQKMSFNRLFLLALLLSMGLTLFSCKDDQGNIKKIESIEIIETQQVVSDSIQCKESAEEQPLVSLQKQKDSIPKPKVIEPPIVDGLIIMGELPLPIHAKKDEAQFKDTPGGLTQKERKTYFNDRINAFVIDHFRISQGEFNLSGKQKIYSQFTIDQTGKVTDINVRGPHPYFEKEVLRVLKLLPEFIPAKQGDMNVSMTYNLPITFLNKD